MFLTRRALLTSSAMSGRTVQGAHGKEANGQPFSRCPVSGATAMMNGKSTRPVTPVAMAAAASENGVFTAVPQDKCPFGFGPAAADGASEATDAEPKAGECPMGFGSAKAKSPTSAMTCTRCSGLFFDAVKTPCGHFFCRACMPPGSDCLMCGADVDTVDPEPKLQELVDSFIRLRGDLAAFETEAGLPKGMLTAASAQGTVKAPEPPAPEELANGTLGDATAPQQQQDGAGAAFLLNAALQSMAGGNIEAARQRFGLCRDELSAQVAKTGYTAGLSSQLGEVCGSQGTCNQRMGDNTAAAENYQESISHLEHSPEMSEEVLHSLTVSHSKLGDLQYAQGNLPAAQAGYRQSLGLRQRAFEEHRASGSGDLRPDLALSLVTSLLKSADIDEAMGDMAAAQAAYEEAERILKDVGSDVAPESAADMKRQALQQFLDARRRVSADAS